MPTAYQNYFRDTAPSKGKLLANVTDLVDTPEYTAVGSRLDRVGRVQIGAQKHGSPRAVRACRSTVIASLRVDRRGSAGRPIEGTQNGHRPLSTAATRTDRARNTSERESAGAETPADLHFRGGGEG